MMLLRLFTLVGLATLLAGCGKASEQAFSDNFDQNFRASCVKAATQKGVDTNIADRICGCAIGEIDRNRSDAQKLAMTDEEVKPIMAECVKKTTQP